MVENKWVNGGIAVAAAGVLAGLAVWMSSGSSEVQSPRGGQPGQVDNEAPAVQADRPVQPGPPTKDRVENDTEAPPPDMGNLPMPKPTK